MPTLTRFVAYYVDDGSENRLSRSALQAQRVSVKQFVGAKAGDVVGEFNDIGTSELRTLAGLDQALTSCGVHCATLVIARLEVVARNVRCLTRLLNSHVKFQVVDLSNCNRDVIAFLLRVAKGRRRGATEIPDQLSGGQKRMGTARANARLSREAGRTGTRRSAAVRSRMSRSWVHELEPAIKDARRNGYLSFAQIAGVLNEKGIQARRGGPWYPMQVKRVVDTIERNRATGCTKGDSPYA